MISYLMFKSLIHFDLIFVSGVRQKTNFIVVHVFTVFSTLFVEKTIFSPLGVFGSLVEY